MHVAITRKVSPQIGLCELTHLRRIPINISAAEEQHRAYEDCLARLGCEVHGLPAEPNLPDSVFVEDAAVVFDEIAIIARPGAESRRPETTSIAAALRPYRELRFIQPPATLDGGDVLCVGKRVFVGISQRTNADGLNQMRATLAPLGYAVEGVPVKRCLHLKSGATRVAEQTLLINPEWIGPGVFDGLDCIEVFPEEPFAANALLIGETVLYPAGYPKTRQRLEQYGIRIMAIDVTELARAEGGVTCRSLVFRGN